MSNAYPHTTTGMIFRNWLVTILVCLLLLVLCATSIFLRFGRSSSDISTQSMSEQSVATNQNEVSDATTGIIFSNPEDFYSVKVPSLGPLMIRYTASPRRTILSWNGNNDYDIEIYFLDNPDNLTAQQYLATEFTDLTNTTSAEMNGNAFAVEYWPSDGILTSFLESTINGLPFMYRIDFVCSAHGRCPSPIFGKPC